MQAIRLLFQCFELLQLDLQAGPRDSAIQRFVDHLGERERPIMQQCIAIWQRQPHEIFEDHKIVIECLIKGDEQLRADCYFLERFYWVASKECANLYRRTIEEDRYIPAREQALRCLTECHFNSQDGELLAFLRGIALSPTEDLNIRRIAYAGIFKVNWGRLKRHPTKSALASFPQTIDLTVM
jgi:hypothetical protein